MPILDSIQAAEEKAEKLKTEATEKVKSLMDNTKIESEEKVKAMFQQAILDEKKLDENTLVRISEKEKEINAEYEQSDLQAISNARGKMDKAIGYIIKKVLEV